MDMTDGAAADAYDDLGSLNLAAHGPFPEELLGPYVRYLIFRKVADALRTERGDDDPAWIYLTYLLERRWLSESSTREERSLSYSIAVTLNGAPGVQPVFQLD